MSEPTLVFGIHAVKGLLLKHPGKIEELLFLDQRQDGRVRELLGLARDKSVHSRSVSKNEFENLLKGQSDAAHQGVIVRIKADRISNESDLDDMLEALSPQDLFLVLDGVTDPHNLGACLRSANAAGVKAVIVPKDKSAPLNPAARKVACGAADITPLIRVTNLSRTIKHMQSYGVWFVGTAGETDHSLHEVSLTGPLAIVMGAEDKGMRRLTRENCDALVKIPMMGEVSSLNVSVATGVCLFEAVRQRHSLKQA
ncbi:23S rRNA (guanosine(2251)-2'-O)-methyltransferase RlmB [Hahella ganghwensis]|uniref:23S rRNA (guanosine(2251)-2'-O)-methyltransferase RlmB n=1 Tax=Hahella ganghwensis TaxID=286420 RepID=UPI00035E46FA|nr:23S rRNA (guanosine(2251)-2'-O)-methyltransferase RlmB [Hahella ganghwensis]